MKQTFLLLACTSMLAVAHAQSSSQPLQAKVNAIVSKMTLEEKAKFVVGNGMKIPGMSGPTVGQTEDKVPGAAGTTFAMPALGVPSMVVSDGPAGVRIDPIRKKDSSHTYYATAWPVGTLLASSWDTALVAKVGRAFGNEVREYGIDVLLGPGMNIHRNPLGGRNFEYYSEDPFVTGKIAAAIVKGIQSNGVGTSIKHFAANEQETNRNTVNTIVSERALREIYLKGFEIAVKEAKPWTVMSSYNYINGPYASENPELLTGILRKEWGFKGFVMSDWFGGMDAVGQIKAGNNLLMPGTAAQSKAILEAVKNGSLDEKVLDENVRGILYVLLQSPANLNPAHSDKPDLKTHAGIAREAAAESMVLLKNEGQALPLSASQHPALFGIGGYELIAGGTGSGDVNKAYTVSIEQGLNNAGMSPEPEISEAYKSYLAAEHAKHPKKGFFEEFMNPTPAPAEYLPSDETIAAKAAASPVAMIAIARQAGEGRDRKTDGDYYLTETEKNLIKKVSDAFHAQHKKVIVILNIGGVIDVTAWRDAADAVLLAWQPGQEGGNAVADVVSGKVNPSGKLATSFPLNYNDVPSAKNFPGTEFPEKATNNGMFGMKRIPAEVRYEEGVYVGYRYYNSFKLPVAYEFGYGLSYSSFKYSGLKLSNPFFAGTLTATVTVTNTGKTAGKEVVQLYLAAPAQKIDKPAEELKGFVKTKLLKPGESQTISFTVSPASLASFDTNSSSWVAEAGNYTVKIGSSSRHFLQTASFKLAKDMVVEKDSHLVQPQVSINEMKNK
jgi:beta-glucosidase